MRVFYALETDASLSKRIRNAQLSVDSIAHQLNQNQIDLERL
ncbi:hypothetical protein [Sporosarcina sp. 6E9]|nr:hypothetical protein [Sporosarcina sp. 6E9]